MLGTLYLKYIFVQSGKISCCKNLFSADPQTEAATFFASSRKRKGTGLNEGLNDGTDHHSCCTVAGIHCH